MKIKVIGLPCAKTNRTLINAQAAATEFEDRPKVHLISDIYEIAEMGRLHTPTVMVNEKLKLTGRIPSVYEIKTWIEEELEEEIAA